ncbi:cell wall metabolism sensor histidine kinase WalK [Paenibacillus donghaensis]|uniref:two-component system histidine kinase PnpS n=1 Tax=Paenibacillus donghaensis TaxID=414771 RepID=UPI0018847D7C|nr:ATP-binding protein [Paenibacillus donghaensis]MBE9912448.1 cell wall metabolism sensor histidine kinase WalK [Paenibacillus donghaensis]
MRPFRIRLTLILMIMIGISMVGAGITMAQLFKKSHISALEDNMIREINLLSRTFDFRPAQGESAMAYYTREAKELAALTDSRVTFISKDGTVIGDSESDPLHMDNHSNREEIVNALKKGNGHAIRYSSTLKEDMLYVAVPVVSGGNYDGFIRLSLSLKSVDEGVRNGWTLMAGGLAILFVVAAIVSYRVAAGLTSPIEKITKVAGRISRLDYDARVDMQRKDEIGELAKAINGMADSLQNQLKTIRDNEDLLQSVLDNMTSGILLVAADGRIALINPAAEEMLNVRSGELQGRSFNELKQYYELTKLIKDGITEREIIHEERSVYRPEETILRLDGVPTLGEDQSFKGMLFLLQDVTAIRRLENMRSEFVANVSHELKTPVAAVKGFSETLLGGGVKDEETARSFLKIIYDESERLNRLISDILDLSKIESKRSPMDYAPIHLDYFCASIMDTIATVAQKKRITLHSDIPEELFVEADEDKLRQILINLLSNAVSYTPDGGKVELSVRDRQDEEGLEKIIFKVSDTGIGIPKKDQPRIFERFYRVDKARSRSSGGTGLGLSIVKHLVELHHGEISVESELGIGTTFTVELPMLQE